MDLPFSTIPHVQQLKIIIYCDCRFGGGSPCYSKEQLDVCRVLIEIRCERRGQVLHTDNIDIEISDYCLLPNRNYTSA